MSGKLSQLGRPLGSVRSLLGSQPYLVKISLAIAVLVVLVAGAGYLITTQTTTLIATETQEELEQSSLVQAQKLDTWSTGIVQETTRVARSEALKSENTARISSYLDRILSEAPRSIVAIHYVEFTGDRARIRGTTERGKAGAILSARQLPWVAQGDTLSAGTGAVSKPYKREIGGQVIAFLEPVEQQENHAVVTVVDPGTASLGLQAPPDGQTFAVNQRGTIVISTSLEDVGNSAFKPGAVESCDTSGEPAGKASVGRGYLTCQAFQRAQSVPSGVFVTTYTDSISYGGSRHLTGITRLSTQNWLLVTQTPTSSAFEVRNQVRGLLLVLVAGVLLIGVGIVGTLGYTTVRDIKTLSMKAREVEQGNYDVELRTDRRDEIGDAYRSVEGMRETLAEQIRESTLVEHSYDLITVIDTDGTITYQSPSAEHIVGLEPEEIEGMNVFEVIHRDHTRELRDAVRAVRTNPDTVERFEFRMQNASQEWRYFEGICENLLENPFVEGLIISSRDVTARKEKETKLREAQQELKQSNEKLEQFAYIASHDLQEPLRMVSSYLDLLEAELDADLDEETGEYLEFAVDGATRMQEMIDGLLEYSRVQTRADPFETVATDEVVASVKQDLGLKIDEAGVELTIGDLPTVTADSSQLGQVFRNLTKNAIEHGDEETTIEITATPRDTATEFAVADTGPGIPPEQQDDLFEIFNKGADSDGTGIGLAVCQQIVHRHGGEIWFESEPGEGTTFYFTIPDDPG